MTKKNKNVILIVVDALRAKSLGVYGKHPSPSPTLDKLAENGILFSNSYTATVTTDPTITSLMTGRYPIRNGLVNNEAKVTPEEVRNINSVRSIAEMLKRNNYHTAAIDWLSRWHRKGFDYYSNSLFWAGGGENKKKRAKADLIYRYMRIIDLLTLRFLKRDFLSRIYYSGNRNRLPFDPADVVIDGAINALKKNSNKSNFFLYIHLWDTHYPYSRQKGFKKILFDSMEDRYLDGVRLVDSQIKRFVEFLKEDGMFKDTLIILTGDHGESLTEHGIHISHRGLYEETVKIPLIFHYPGFSPKKITSLVQHIDIAPTILDFLNIEYFKEEFDGKSLIPLIEGKAEKLRDFVYFEDLTYGEHKIRKDVRRRGIRTQNYKYIQSLYGYREFLFSVFPKTDKLMIREELYDLEKDPTEKSNIMSQKPELTEQLRKRLNEFIKKFDRKVLDKNRKNKLFLKKTEIGKKSYNEEQVMKKFRKMGYW